MTKNCVKAIPISGMGSGALLLGVYQAVTPAGGIPNACFILKINNTSNRDVYVSYDAEDINDVIRAGEDRVINFQVNSSPQNKRAVMKKGTEVYLEGDPAGAAGWIYLSGYYQEQ